MRAPSVKKLCDELKLEPAQARLIRKLAHAVDDKDLLQAIIEAECPHTAAYARSCYNDPFIGGMWRRTMALHAIDNVLGTQGVEPLGAVDMHAGPPFEYCNAGDPYAATLIYSRASDTLRIGCWGDIAERMPKREES